MAHVEAHAMAVTGAVERNLFCGRLSSEKVMSGEHIGEGKFADSQGL
jgi:hypothetical protein